MTTLQTTVVMKTDIGGSTPRFRALSEADLSALLAEHREFLTRNAATHGGRIVKPEGDGFWLVFPSATAATLAASAMQEELRFAQPNRGDDRLAMRIVIALGDVLHQEGGLIGDTIVLTTRIEAITPLDEIYLSAAAWLAVNPAEIRTSLVDTFPLKGFAEPIPVYRVEQTYRTQIITNQYIVVTDLVGFGRMLGSGRMVETMTTIEKILDALFETVNRTTRELGGIIRFSAGDSYCLTFVDGNNAICCAERLSESWAAFVRQSALNCTINVAIHQGTMYAYRSYFYGPGINIASNVEAASRRVLAPNEGAVFVTGEVRKNLVGTAWHSRLDPVDIQSRLSRLAGIEVFRLKN